MTHRTLLAVLTFMLGCGELADQDSKPPVISTIRGSLRLAANAVATEGTLRLALVWSRPSYEQPDDACLPLQPMERWIRAQAASRTRESRLLLGGIEQAVELTPQFPSAFTLELTEPPPAGAMYLRDDGANVAEGELIVYRDGNGNGKLDPHTDEAASPDEVLSNTLNAGYGLLDRDPNIDLRPWGYSVWYLDRPRSYAGGLLDLHAGYNVLGYGRANTGTVEQVDLELLPTPVSPTRLCTTSVSSRTSRRSSVPRTRPACPPPPRAR